MQQKNKYKTELKYHLTFKLMIFKNDEMTEIFGKASKHVTSTGKGLLCYTYNVHMKCQLKTQV